MTEVLLIRHALPEAGTLQPGLGDEGRAQAEACADWLGGAGIDAIAVSPLLRARQTAAPAAGRLGLTPVVVDDLREWVRDGDPPEYRPLEDMPADHPQARALAEGRLADFVPSFDRAAFRQQAARALEEICARWPGQRVAAFSHGGKINTILAGVLGLESVFWFVPGYCSVSRVERLASGVTLVRSVNEQPSTPPQALVASGDLSRLPLAGN